MHEFSLQSTLLNPWKLNWYFLRNLPMAWLAGLKIEVFNNQSASVSVPFGYLTQNPFRSTYFACLAMAGELASGIQVLDAAMGSHLPISTLVTGIEGHFYKKAVSKTFFTCDEGNKIRKAVLLASTQDEPVTLTTLSAGVDSNGHPIAEFSVTWSFKRKK